eukprot:2913362-Prymnesium_polylepis.1
MGLLQNDRNAPGETKSPTQHQPAEMSNSDTINQQEREDKIKQMDSMCVMIKGKQTYLGLTRRQWIDRILEVDPTTKHEELTEGDFHIVEVGQACEGSDDDSEDEEKEHEYNGK